MMMMSVCSTSVCSSQCLWCVAIAMLLTSQLTIRSTASLSDAIRLSESVNYLATMALWIPVMATTLALRAFDRASDATFDARRRRRAAGEPRLSRTVASRSRARSASGASLLDDEVLFDRAAIQRYASFTMAEMPQWALFVIYLVALLVVSAARGVTRVNFQLVGQLVLATVGVALSAWLLRNLVAAVMRRQQGATTAYVRFFRYRGYQVIALQAVLFTYGLSRSASTPWLVKPVAYNPVLNPCAHVDEAYIEAHCVRGLALHGPLLLCTDDGYGLYNSTLAACEAARAQWGYLAQMTSALMCGFNGFLFLLFRQLWRLHDADLESTELRMGAIDEEATSQREMRLAVFVDEMSPCAAIGARGRLLLHFIAKGSTLLALACCPLFLCLLIAPPTNLPESSTRSDNSLVDLIASGTLGYVNIGLWCLSYLSFNIDSIIEAITKAVGPRADLEVFLQGRARPESLKRQLHGVAADLGGLHNVRARGVDISDAKFVLEPKYLETSRTDLRGLNFLLGCTDEAVHLGMADGVAAIQREFDAAGTDSDRECLCYVLHAAAGSSERLFSPNSKRDCDANGALLPARRRADGEPMVLADFVAHRHSRDAALTEAQVVALR